MSYLSSKTILILCVMVSVSFCAQTNLRKQLLGAIPWEFDNCGSENDPIVVTGITLDGMPEKGVGDNINIVGVSNVHDRITQARIDVFLTQVKITSITQAYPQDVDPGDMWIFQYGSFIPNIAPAGFYTIKFTFLNKSQKQLSCVSINMNL